MRDFMRKHKLFILATILFMAIGFAAVTTTLIINGTLRIGTNPQDFDNNIVFIETKTDDSSVASISTDGKIISFVARELKSLGDEVTLNFVVKNKSKQYDADAIINCDYSEDNNYNEYANIKINPSEFILRAQEKQDGNLTIRLVKSFIGTEDDDSIQIAFQCRISANALERDNLAEEIKEPSDVLASDYLDEISNTNQELMYDGTIDNNLRFVGNDPHNYLEFNGELWRIIGLMNNVSDEEGNKRSYIKIIRNESIGSYAWDIRLKNNFSNSSNNWANSTLMSTLNEDAYFNRSKGECAINTYPDKTYKTDCDFSETGLKESSKKMLKRVVWKLGSTALEYPDKKMNADWFYKGERSKSTYNNYPVEWTGFIGLMYPSDFGYSIDLTENAACSSIDITSNSGSDCYADSWLNFNGGSQWTLSPSTYGSNVNFSSYYVGNSYASESMGVRPTAFLKESVRIMRGTGTRDNPYIVG